MRPGVVRDSCPSCQWRGCGEPGLYPAPKGRGHEGEYHRYCLDSRAASRSMSLCRPRVTSARAAYGQPSVGEPRHRLEGASRPGGAGRTRWSTRPAPGSPSRAKTEVRCAPGATPRTAASPAAAGRTTGRWPTSRRAGLPPGGGRAPGPPGSPRAGTARPGPARRRRAAWARRPRAPPGPAGPAGRRSPGRCRARSPHRPSPGSTPPPARVARWSPAGRSLARAEGGSNERRRTAPTRGGAGARRRSAMAIETMAVVGAGQMGSGIAQVAAQAGLERRPGATPPGAGGEGPSSKLDGDPRQAGREGQARRRRRATRSLARIRPAGGARGLAVRPRRSRRRREQASSR